MKKYAIKEPRIETIESVSKYLNQYSPLYTGYLCVFRDSAALVDWFKNKNMPGRSHFYNSDGYRIITQDSSFCSGVETNFAGNLKINQVFRIDSTMKFSKLTKNLLPVGEKVNLDPSQYAVTCVIFWADFMGRMNDQNFQIAESAMKSQPGINGRLNILFVDMDIMDFWNTSGNLIKTSVKTR